MGRSQKPKTAEHPALEICLGGTNLHYMVFWRLVELESKTSGILRETEIPVEIKYPQPTAMGQKAETLKDFPTVRGLLRGKDCTELAAQEKGEVDRFILAHSSQQVGNFQELQVIHPPGWERMLRPHHHNSAPCRYFRPAGIRSKIYPCHCTRPAKGWPHL